MRDDGPVFTRVRIVGPSMEPALRNGDWWVVRRGGRPGPGAVVLMRHPRRPDALIVKRLAHRTQAGWWVLGDQPERSEDSRQFGEVPDACIVGRLVWRYRRGPRAGGAP
jgi:nickel-type superoxide dismutase maturation protease